MEGNKQNAALNVDRCKKQFRGKSKERGKSHSKSRSTNIITIVERRDTKRDFTSGGE